MSLATLNPFAVFFQAAPSREECLRWEVQKLDEQIFEHKLQEIELQSKRKCLYEQIAFVRGYSPQTQQEPQHAEAQESHSTNSNASSAPGGFGSTSKAGAVVRAGAEGSFRVLEQAHREVAQEALGVNNRPANWPLKGVI